MVASINGGGRVMSTAFKAQVKTSEKESIKPASDSISSQPLSDVSDDATPAALQQKLVEMADDMASVASQFRNRREFEKKTSSATENFDHVLEQDAVPKSQKLLEITKVAQLSIDNLLAQARSLFPDESDLFLVLRELLKRKQVSQTQRRHLEALLEKVTQEADPKMLKAGIHCALKARLFGARLGLEAKFLRQTYRRYLESGRSPIADYEGWISSYGYQSRHFIVDFIEESLGIDIRSEDPSCDHLEFSYLLAHMKKVHILRTADREFVGALLNRRLVPAYKEEEADWLLLFFGLTSRSIAAGQLLREMLGASLLATHSQRSAWINAVRSAYKRLPIKLLMDFPEPLDDEEIDQVIEETIVAMDKLIDQSYAAEMLEIRRFSE